MDVCHDELRGMWEKQILANYKELFQYVPHMTEENHEKPIRIAGTWQWFQPWIIPEYGYCDNVLRFVNLNLIKYIWTEKSCKS
jgi:hypothetical protein